MCTHLSPWGCFGSAWVSIQVMNRGRGHRCPGGQPSTHLLVLSFLLYKMGTIKAASPGPRGRGQSKAPGAASWIQMPAALSFLGTRSWQVAPPLRLVFLGVQTVLWSGGESWPQGPWGVEGPGCRGSGQSPALTKWKIVFKDQTLYC